MARIRTENRRQWARYIGIALLAVALGACIPWAYRAITISPAERLFNAAVDAQRARNMTFDEIREKIKKNNQKTNR